MNPFSRPNTAEQEVTKLALAPSNPPKVYARGSSDMLKKLLSISENTRRQLSQQEAAGAGQVENKPSLKRAAVTVSLLGGRQYAEERGTVDRLTTSEQHAPSRADERMEKGPLHPEDVIDLVCSDDDVPDRGGQASDEEGADCADEYCAQEEHGAPLRSQTGVALFDVFDEADEADRNNRRVDRDEYEEYESYDEYEKYDQCVEYEEYSECAGRFGQDENVDTDAGRKDALHAGDNPAPYGLPEVVEGSDWWRKLPDFQPISSIVRAGNRDVRGEAVVIDFLGQFKGTRLSSSPHGSGASIGRRSAAATKSGHWETRGGQRTFVSAAGTALTGLNAYREYTKGTKRKISSSKPRRRKKKK